MRWLIALTVVAWSACSAFGESIRVTTWNLEWFPNGSPKEAPAEVQNQRISKAAEVLRKINPDVLLLQEVKDYESCQKLAESISPNTYTVAICSAFRDPFGGGIGSQQVAILSKYPALAAWAESWRALGKVDPPRGFAFAWFQIGNADLGIYCVHLKSNLVRGGSESEIQRNILKREISTEQLVAHLKSTTATAIPNIKTVIIGGDFNTNPDERTFISEKTFQNLTDFGFLNCWSGWPVAKRITHPGKGRYPDSTFDYLFVKNGTVGKPSITTSTGSDHLPVTSEIQIFNPSR